MLKLCLGFAFDGFLFTRATDCVENEGLPVVCR